MLTSEVSLQISRILAKQELHEGFTLELYQRIVSGAQPFSVVEGDEFKRFVTTCNP